MKTRKTNTNTTNRPSKYHTLLAALAAMTLTGIGSAQARTVATDSASPVTVVSREQLDELPINQRNLNDLANLTPGVVTDTYAGGRYNTNNGNTINLRGLGTGQNANGYHLDGVPYNTRGVYHPAGGYNPADIERIEVLRGPQGTLYGRNNLGGTINLNPRVNDQPETFNPSGLTVGQTFDTYDLSPTYKMPGLGLNLNTTYNTDPLNDAATDAPADTVADNPAADTHAGGTSAPATTGQTQTYPSQPQPYNNVGYDSHGDPCPRGEIDWSRIRIRQADDARVGAANTAQSLLHQSQPNRFYDFSYHNTASDELAGRAYISGQFTGNSGITGCYAGPGYDFGPGGYPDPRKPYIGGNETPKTYYRVGSDYPTIPINNGDTDNGDGEAHGTATTTTATPPAETPIPTYPPTVHPIDPSDMRDAMLGIEIEYGPKLVKHYLDQAKEQRDDAKDYTERAARWRADAQRARENADHAREEAKKATSDSSREFWEQQANSYDDHARIMEDSARLMDRSAANANAAAESFEADAAQTANNFGQAVNEQANRTAQTASEAARAQTAREAEAARVEAERQKALDDLIRNSQQSTQSNTGGTSDNNAGGNGGSTGPDMREPQIGREPRNETLRKLLD